jgi:nucleotide-binding universal stress UspA family protein
MVFSILQQCRKIFISQCLIIYIIQFNNQRRYHEKKLSKILVAIDGSSYSMYAAHHAIRLSLQYDAQLVVLHVLYPMEIHSSFQIYEFIHPIPIKEWIEIRKIDIQKWFDSIKKKAAEYSSSGTNKKINMRFEIIVSTSIVRSILDYAEKENVDLIVVGTRGHSGIKKLLLGSTALGLVTYASCPVTVVK